MRNLELMHLAKIKHSTRVLKSSRNAQTLVKSELDFEYAGRNDSYLSAHTLVSVQQGCQV